MLPLPVQLCLLLFAGWLNRHQQAAIDYLREENRVLREQLGERRLRFTDRQRSRLAVKANALGRKVLGELGTIVTPDTLLRWYPRLVAAKYDGSARRKPLGRPRSARTAEVVELVLGLARENPRYGYTRIRDVMNGLGYEISRSSVKRILDEHGIEPAPSRAEPWSSFLAAQWEGLAAGDVFTVEVMTWFGLVRYEVFFVLRLASREVHVAGVAHDASGNWLLQLGRNLTDPVDGFLGGVTHLILDRDPLYTKRFRELLGGSGVKVVRLPAASPNLNACAERWIRSIRNECLSRFIPLSEAHLRNAIREYVEHYNRERPHQGLGGALIDPDETASRRTGGVVCRERLGGLLRYYHREAA